MRVPLAANSSYLTLFAGPRSLLRGYTHNSAPASTRKEILELLFVTKMRRDPESPSHATFTGSWPRFPDSSCKGFGTFLLGRGIGQSVVSFLKNVNVGISSVIMEGADCWGTAC